MAILTQGLLGGTVGKAGPTVSYISYGQNIVRSKGNTRKNKIITPARKKQRNKIILCNGFTRAFSGTGFFDKSFPAYGHTGSGYNRATSAIMNGAITADTIPVLAYNKILISKGPIPAADNVTVSKNDAGNIVFSWMNNSGIGTAKANDKAVLVAFFPKTGKATFAFSDATRQQQTAVLELSSQSGIAETWLGFLSADEKNAANSVYAGSVTIVS